MKKLIILILLLFSLPAYSQLESFIPEDFRLKDEYQEVVETGLSDIMMYSNAKEWIAKTFRDYKAVIQFEDETTKKLIIKGICYGDTSDREALSFTMTIDCKDKKFRYSISNISITGNIRGEIWNEEKNYHYEYFNNSKSKIAEAQESIDNLNKRKEPLLNRKLNKKEKEELYKIRLDISQSLDDIKYFSNQCDNHSIFQRKDSEAIHSLILSLKNAMKINNVF